MKRTLLFIIFLLNLISSAYSQDVAIPDSNFLAELINRGIDTNGDGVIQVDEAEVVTYLYLSDKQINSLIGIEAFTALEDLKCSFNPLGTLDLSNNINLEKLHCGFCHLDELNISGCSKLSRLQCFANNLNDIDLSHMPNLTKLDCSFNNLMTLDVSANVDLEELWCGKNNLSFLDLSEQIELSEFYLSNEDELTHICCNVENYVVVAQEVANEDLSNTTVSFVCADEYVKYNSVMRLSDQYPCDSGLIVSEFFMSLVFDGDTVGFIPNGFLLDVPLTDNGIVLLPSFPALPMATVIDSVIILDSLDLITGVDSNGVYNDTFCALVDDLAYDLSTTLMSFQEPRPGFVHDYKLIYENNGVINTSGTVGLRFSSPYVSFLSSSPTPDHISADSLTWNFTDLEPFENKHISLEFRLNSPMDNPPLNDGDVITFLSCILPTENDYDPTDNCFELKQVVVNSYDPNDKRCLQGDILPPDKVGEWLTYMIRFENTGSADAVNIRVTDIIDTAVFDVASLKPIDASHPYHVEILNGNQVHFVFPEIYLPFDDENNDGYITFRIRTRDDLILGDMITNQASIFFDFNFPIITNNAITEVKEQNVFTKNQFRSDVDVDIFPNPTQGDVVISSPYPIYEVAIMTTDNKVVQLIKNINPSVELPLSLSSLNKGIYIVELRTKEGVGVEKLIVVE